MRWGMHDPGFLCTFFTRAIMSAKSRGINWSFHQSPLKIEKLKPYIVSAWQPRNGYNCEQCICEWVCVWVIVCVTCMCDWYGFQHTDCPCWCQKTPPVINLVSANAKAGLQSLQDHARSLCGEFGRWKQLGDLKGSRCILYNLYIYKYVQIYIYNRPIHHPPSWAVEKRIF